MIKPTRVPLKLLSLAAVALLMSSCAVTSRTTQGTSETFQNTSEASTKFSSSTSPRSDEKKESAVKVKAFAAANIQRLEEDIARGGGEHLSSFAHLLGILDSHRAEFYAMTKEKYPVLFSSNPTTSEQLLARMDAELDAHPQWCRR
jgi:hypothetical protein